MGICIRRSAKLMALRIVVLTVLWLGAIHFIGKFPEDAFVAIGGIALFVALTLPVEFVSETAINRVMGR